MYCLILVFYPVQCIYYALLGSQLWQVTAFGLFFHQNECVESG